MRMDDEDWALSMTISRRARNDVGNECLRSLLVHRLTVTLKGVLRKGLNSGRNSVFCEACGRWQHVGTETPKIWQCQGCLRVYAIEFAVYEEVSQGVVDEPSRRADRRATPPAEHADHEPAEGDHGERAGP